MKTEVLTPEERVFTVPEDISTQNVFIRIQTCTVRIATLPIVEALTMRDKLRELVKDASTQVCFHTGEVVCELKKLCHKLDMALMQMTPSAVESVPTQSSSPFAFDRNAKKDSEVKPYVEKLDATSVVKPKAVFKGTRQTSDSAGAPLKVEIGNGLWVPVDTKMIVSPGGLAPSCECSWSGCQHPSHNADRLERQEVKDVESDKPYDSRNIPDVSVDPLDVIPGEEKSDDLPSAMCTCGFPDCSHPSHKTGYLND